MALDAGSVAVRVGADFQGQGFDRYDRAVKGAEARAAKAIKQTLGAEADEAGFNRWEARVAAARAKAQRPIKQEFELDIDWRSFATGVLAARTGTAALTKESGKLGDVFNRSQLSIGQWVIGLGAALPIIVDLGAALGALTASAGAAMAGLGALAVGAAGAMTVGFGGIAAIAAPAISSLTDLISAQDAADKAQTTGAAGAARASEASAHQITAAREQVAAATRGVTTAEGQLEAAQESAEIAQESLTQAREDATRQLQDMRLAAMGADESEEAARIGLRRAEQELRRVRGDMASGALDIREAENEVALARINLRDVTIQGNRAQQDYNEARRGGVKEMPGVVSAEQAYDSALASVEQAANGVRDAERTRRAALRDLTYQQRQANAATGAGGTAMAALAAAQRKAGPAAVALARQIKDLGDRWRGLTRGGRADFFGMLSDGVDRLQGKLPMLARSANRSMVALRDGFGEFLDRATGPEFDTFVSVMTRTFEKTIGPIARGLGNIAVVLQRIAVAVAPEVVNMAEGFEGMTEGWLDSTKNAGKLRDTVGGLVDHAEAWWDLLVASKDLIIAALVPGMGEGKNAVKDLTDQFREWTDWLDANPDKVKDFFKDGMDTARELGEILIGMIETLKDVSDFLRPIVRGIIDVAQALNSVKVGNVSALEALIAAFIAFKGAQKVKDASDAIREMGGNLRGVSRRARDMFDTVRIWSMYAREGVADFMGNVVSGIRTRAGRVRTAIGNAMKHARTFVTSAATGAAEFVGSMVGGIRNSRLANSLRSIFKRIAVRLGAVMASTVAAAVVAGEAIGGAASSLAGRLNNRLPDKMRGAGRVAGRAFGTGMLVGILAAIPLIVTMVTKKIREKLSLDADVSEGGGLWGGSPFGISIPGLDQASGWVQRNTGASPPDWLTGRQHGGPVEAGQPYVVGEREPELFIPRTSGRIVPGPLGGLAGFGRGAEAEGRRGSEGFVKALVDGGRKAKTVAERLRKDTLDEFGKIRKGTGDDTDKMRKRTVDDFDTARDKATDSAKDLRKRVGDSYRDLRRDHDGELRSMRGNVADRFGEMADTAKRDSRRLSGSVTGSMRNVSGVVFRGMSYIARATNKALQAFDVKRVDLNLDPPRLRQQGGHLPGGRTGDRNLLIAEDDEYVLNRNVTRGLGKDVLDWLNFKVYPRQEGGVVSVPGFPGESANRAVIPALTSFARRFNLMLTDAYGPGHASTEHTRYGTAADFVPGPGGSWAQVGQAAQAAVRAGYTPVGWDGSGGTEAWSGHGPPSVAGANAHVHITFLTAAELAAGQHPGAAGGMAENIRRLLVKGPDGPMKDIAQAALDRARREGNRYIDGHAISEANDMVGIQGDGDVERMFARVAKKVSTSRTATMALGEAGFAETGMRDLSYGDSTSQGALQLLASTASGMGIDPHDEGAIASAFLLRGFTGRGGANVLAAQGLPAHLVAQGVQGSAFSTGSNYAAQRGNALDWMRRFGLQRGGIVGMQAGGAAGPGGPGGRGGSNTQPRRREPWSPNHPRARRRWRGALGEAEIPEHFDDLFSAIGAGSPGMARGPEDWLLNTDEDPSIRDAQRIEDRILRNLRREGRQTRRLADRRVEQLHDPAARAWDALRKARVARRRGDMSGREFREVRGNWQDTRADYHRGRRGVRRGEDRRLAQLEASRGQWRGRTDRRIESMLGAGFGQVSQFQADRAELFGTFGSNFEGPRGPGAAFGPRAFGATGGSVARPVTASGGAFGGQRVHNGDIHLNNYFRESPREPHIWARGAMFELRAAT